MVESEVITTSRNYYAWTGLILSIVGVFLYSVGIVSLLAIISSSIGLAKAKHYGGKGKVQAMIGLVLGVVLTLIYIIKSAGYI